MIKITSTDLNLKQNLLVSGGNIKTINGESLLGTGDIVISGGASPPPPAVTATYVKNTYTLQLPFSTSAGMVSSYTSFGEAIPITGNVSITSQALDNLWTDFLVTDVDLGNVSVIGETVLDNGSIATLVAPSLEAINGSFLIEATCTGLVALSFPVLKVVADTLRIDVPSSIAFPELLSVDKLRISVAGVHYTTPKLKYITGDFYASNTGTFDGSVLEQVGDYFDTSGLSPSREYPVLTRVNGNLTLLGNADVFVAPLLNFIGSVLAFTNDTGTVFTLPSLQKVGQDIDINCNGAAGLTTITLPALINVGGGISITNSDDLANLTIGTIGVTKLLQNIYIGNTVLTTVSLDRLLALLVSLDGTNGTTLWGANALVITSTAQAPSATGIANKVILEGRGATISI